MHATSSKLTAQFAHLFPMACFSVFVIFMVGMVSASHQKRMQYNTYMRKIAAVSVIPPGGIPAQNQESIDAAVELFSIKIPAHVKGPKFDSTLDDRGLTTGGTVQERKFVTIGPAAFTSWSVLGSTIGHETEIHANQSFLAIVTKDRFTDISLAVRKKAAVVFPALKPTARELFDNEGTWAAEREAYLYEVNSAKRFHLSSNELQSIVQVMNFYYPERQVQFKKSGQLSVTAKKSMR